MILEKDGVVSKTSTKNKVKSPALKAKVTREQTSEDTDSQDGSDEDVDEEEEAKAFNLLARNLHKFFRKGNRFECRNRFGKSRENSFVKKYGEGSKLKGACYNCEIEGHFASECRKPKENKLFFGGAWSDSKHGDEQKNDATCLMAIDSQEVVSKPSGSKINLNTVDLQKENVELLRFNKYFAKTFKKLLNEKRSLEKENSKLSSKINNLEMEVKKQANDKEAYDGRHVVFGNNLKGKVIDGGDNSKQQICFASVVDNSTLYHRRLGHANISLVQNLASYKLVRNLPHLSFERHFCDTCGLGSQGNANNMTRNKVSTSRVLELLHLDLFRPSPIQSYEGVFLGYSQTSKASIVLNKETIKIKESLNVTFDESLPEPKPSISVEDDKINEPIVQDLNRSPVLQVNVLDKGYPKSLKKARAHPIE
nr:retrotransposon protein [Tanacetum cinerariifolium]